MPRAFLLVLDSFGCGGAADAAAFGDAGADTLGHIAQACEAGRADRAGLRKGPLHLPFLDKLGLGLLAEASTGNLPHGLTRTASPQAAWGYGVETSKGKDTPSGHWEIAGSPVDFAWGYFPDTYPAFPLELTRAIVAAGKLPGILGDRHASGTDILDELGDEHIASGKPILYTSVDSVLQIAAHETAFGLERLYELCRAVRMLVDPLNIGRVIARPFTGPRAGEFERTPNRKDFAMPPPAGNLLDRATEANRTIMTVGKIGDIFAHRNTGQEIKGHGHADLIEKTLRAIEALPDGGFLFANYLDLDTEYGHRRDVPGAAACIEDFDQRLVALSNKLKPGDVVVFTADHGNDPTWRGTDHTREHAPILAFGPDLAPRALGRRDTFADIGASLAAHLELAPTKFGRSWW